jgi:peptidoglycan/xylan/chitin deacetylase (PgdA/CDA1 family)
MRGYGARPPHPRWPGDARVAISIALNYEGGGERTILDGDATSESMLTDIGFPEVVGSRSMLVESSFEYGSRRGVWRVLILRERQLRVSLFGVATALARNPEVAQAAVVDGHEIVSHGFRWIDYQHVTEAVERDHILMARDTITKIIGQRPVGWMTGRPSPNTRRLLVEEGGFLYDRDALNDELPYWVTVGAGAKPHLVIPYSYETNDNRFNENSGFSTSDDYVSYMSDSFDVLYAEGADEPRMMSVGLHDRLIGRPGRAAGLMRFLDHVLAHDRVWICTGRDVAEHWIKTHPFAPDRV